jgi:hypothetical protein
MGIWIQRFNLKAPGESDAPPPKRAKAKDQDENPDLAKRPRDDDKELRDAINFFAKAKAEREIFQERTGRFQER